MSPRNVFFRRREVWLPTWKGWLVLGAMGVAVVVALMFLAPAFLAPHAPLRGEALVVEGWMPDEVLDSVVEEFRSNDYELIVVTGGPLAHGSYLKEFGDYASLGRASLVALGLPEDRVVAVPAPHVERQRTLSAAVALRQWLEDRESGGGLESIDVVSLDVHARRSWIVFADVLEGVCEVGVIALEDPELEGVSRWRTSHGVKSLITEIVAYIYTIFVAY